MSSNMSILAASDDARWPRWWRTALRFSQLLLCSNVVEKAAPLISSLPFLGSDASEREVAALGHGDMYRNDSSKQ